MIFGNDFLSRLVGLINKDDNTLMFLPNCRAIHTFFMKKDMICIALNQDFEEIDRLIIKPRRVKFFCEEVFHLIEYIPKKYKDLNEFNFCKEIEWAKKKYTK